MQGSRVRSYEQDNWWISYSSSNTKCDPRDPSFILWQCEAPFLNPERVHWIRMIMCSQWVALGPCENPRVYSPFFVCLECTAQGRCSNTAQHSLTHRQTEQSKANYTICWVSPRGLNSLHVRVRVHWEDRGLIWCPPPKPSPSTKKKQSRHLKDTHT